MPTAKPAAALEPTGYYLYAARAANGTNLGTVKAKNGADAARKLAAAAKTFPAVNLDEGFVLERGEAVMRKPRVTG